MNNYNEKMLNLTRNANNIYLDQQTHKHTHTNTHTEL